MNTPATTPAVPDYGAPAALPPTHLLTAEQIAFYQEHGYLAIEAIMPAAEIETVKRIYDRLFNEDRELTGKDTYDLTGARAPGRKEAIPQILQPGKYAPALLQTQMVANLKAMMKLLHGAENEDDGRSRHQQAAVQRRAHPMAPGRGVLGSGEGILESERVDTPAACDQSERLHVLCAGVAPA